MSCCFPSRNTKKVTYEEVTYHPIKQSKDFKRELKRRIEQKPKYDMDISW